MTIELPYRPLPVDQSHVRYLHGPDSSLRDEVPPGRTLELTWESSRIYPGTRRKVWVHVPSAYTGQHSANLLVMQDGWLYLDPVGEIRAGVVLDNLVHRGELPVTIGVFVDPGVVPDAEEPKNRNIEYDAFDDRYAEFLLTEIVPLVTREFSISEDPDDWAICGGSSGGNCAFTAAWMRPDRFGRVIGFLSSFVQMPGGNPYPALIPAMPVKPLRIFLGAGHRDLNWNQPEDNWFAANLRVAAALAEAGYDMRLVVGDGGHNTNHSGVLLPDALRWIWRPGASSSA